MRIIVTHSWWLYAGQRWQPPAADAFVRVGAAAAIWQVVGARELAESETIETVLDAVEAHAVPLNALIVELPKPIGGRRVSLEELMEEAFGGVSPLLARTLGGLAAESELPEVWV